MNLKNLLKGTQLVCRDSGERDDQTERDTTQRSVHNGGPIVEDKSHYSKMNEKSNKRPRMEVRGCIEQVNYMSKHNGRSQPGW